VIAGLRLLLLLAYLPLAHFAGARHSPLLAALALGDLVLLLLIDGLLRPRLAAWLALVLAAAGLMLLAHSPYALLPLLLVPPLFTALVAIWFARSLRPGRVPLITRVVAALYRQTLDALSPRHHRYARNLTLAWSLLLAAMTLLNLALALIAVPDGMLARLDITAPVTVTGEQWSLIANLANYGVLGGFALIEYQVRKFVFPVRPYRNVVDFARQMAALGPAFWRDFFRGA
jgi:uncharacterized membrane protein